MSMRIATSDDQEAIVRMALKFVNSTDYKHLADETTIRSLVYTLIQAPTTKAIALIYEDVGMIGGIISPFIYGPSLVATELAWWVEPDARGLKAGAALIEAFEYWALLNRCKAITMVSLGDNIAKYYEKRGYKLRENVYMKEIN